MNRTALLKMVHAGARRLGWDDATYRAWMKLHSTQSSCALCSDAELSHLVDLLRDLGALDPNPAAPLPPTGNPEQPTPHQWRYALDLSRRLGMTGTAHDPDLIAFCQRTTKLASPRFLTRALMQDLIAGLERWHKSRQKRAGNDFSTSGETP
jgi:hypothetical protein